VPPKGQQWTTPSALAANYTNQFSELEPHLFEIKTVPLFAITQRAMLVQSEEGNILWDCLSLVDQATVDKIHALGGVQAIAISHPHFYGSMVDWSRALGHIPIYIHEADQQFVMRPDPAIVFWKGENYQLNKELTLVHCGGHFPGSSILHWPKGAEGRGVLLSGDTIFVTQDTRYVSFMYSYPNLIPLGAQEILQILKAIKPFSYDRIYNGWLCCESNAQHAVKTSVSRYLTHIGADFSF
jgi:glyoxylase-like metal-dependent hydrolase (beta-lactamase superfamily II)